MILTITSTSNEAGCNILLNVSVATSVSARIEVGPRNALLLCILLRHQNMSVQHEAHRHPTANYRQTENPRAHGVRRGPDAMCAIQLNSAPWAGQNVSFARDCERSKNPNVMVVWTEIKCVFNYWTLTPNSCKICSEKFVSPPRTDLRLIVVGKDNRLIYFCLFLARG